MRSGPPDSRRSRRVPDATETRRRRGDMRLQYRFESFKLNREKAIEPGETTASACALALGHDFYDELGLPPGRSARAVARSSRSRQRSTGVRDGLGMSEQSHRAWSRCRMVPSLLRFDRSQPAGDGRCFRSAGNRGDVETRLLRLPLQRNAMAMVQPRRTDLMAGGARGGTGTQANKLLRVGRILPSHAKTKASMDGQGAAPGGNAAVVAHRPPTSRTVQNRSREAGRLFARGCEAWIQVRKQNCPLPARCRERRSR